MQSLDSISLDLTNALVPLIAIFLSLGLGFFIKDLIANFVTGIRFKFDGSFNEGDKCIVDGDRAVLVKVGIYESVFSIINGRGHVWRFVPNERIKFLKIEKIIEEPKE
tara:strand:- start:3546 stop:3869 length:324 start_codon:yes stop_codon:yes gene_type:complete